jgi:hypothetical protein
VVIPLTIGAMLLYVAADWRRRRKEHRPPPSESSPAPEPRP